VVFNTINKLVNVNGFLYLVPRGLGSGDYLTSVINVCWRLYLILDSYSYPIEKFFVDNTVIINGDDLIMSSIFSDLNLSSRHVSIEWAGKPITWKEADFCSLTFHPFIHHDPKKVLAVLYQRIPRPMMLNPVLQMQRLGGILRVLSTKEVYDIVLSKMVALAQKEKLYDEFINLYIGYPDLFRTYNSHLRFHFK